MKTRFLWIEDGATADLRHLLAPILVDGSYDPTIALGIRPARFSRAFGSDGCFSSPALRVRRLHDPLILTPGRHVGS